MGACPTIIGLGASWLAELLFYPLLWEGFLAGWVAVGFHSGISEGVGLLSFDQHVPLLFFFYLSFTTPLFPKVLCISHLCVAVYINSTCNMSFCI